MYAFVRYNDDKNNKYIVPTSQIEDFNPDNIDYNAIYQVYWQQLGKSSDETVGKYYPARILLVASTEEELEMKAQEKRLRVPKVLQDTCSKSVNSSIKTQKPILKDKHRRDKTTQKKLQEIMKTSQQKRKMVMDSSEESDEEYLVPSTTVDEEKAKYNVLLQRCQKLAADNEKLRSLNEKLQLALTASVMGQNENDSTEKISLQGADKKHLEITCPSPKQESIISNGKEPETSEFHVEILQNGDVDLGSTVISSSRWKEISSSAKTVSIFCKELAMTMWTPEELCERSVTGAKCNANKDLAPKKPLTPVKVQSISSGLRYYLQKKGHPEAEIQQSAAKINKYLREKICDLNKRKR